MSIHIAHILLQAGGGDTTRTVGNGAIGVLAAQNRGAGGFKGSGVGKSDEGENGGECELHVGGRLGVLRRQMIGITSGGVERMVRPAGKRIEAGELD